MKLYTTKSAVQFFGKEKINELLGKNCEPTNQVGYNGSCQGDEEVEFSASVKIDPDDYPSY